ncbi:MAG: hypothetical protein ACK41C_18945 [Phenylobacterium sp.]|jgi:hypothetical protein|uniref:hypothetical protein n=1 Tax=Phenylobacterium sp. TaxID=1871053 RepID=UPI00391A126E
MSLLLAALAALATGTAEAAPPADEALKPGQRKAKMICNVETPTGSRVGKRVCLTEEDFKRRQEESREGFAEMQRNHNVNRSSGN